MKYFTLKKFHRSDVLLASYQALHSRQVLGQVAIRRLQGPLLASVRDLSYYTVIIVVKYKENMASNGFRDALSLLINSEQVALVMHDGDGPFRRPFAWCA